MLGIHSKVNKGDAQDRALDGGTGSGTKAGPRRLRSATPMVLAAALVAGMALGAVAVTHRGDAPRSRGTADTSARAAADRSSGHAPATRQLAAASAASAAKGRLVRNLFLRYRTKAQCDVYLNFPKSGVLGNAQPGFSVPSGELLVWRYNADGEWAVVTLPARKRAGTYPWWGFTRRGCIGTSVRQTDVWRVTGKKPNEKRTTVKWYPAGRPVSDRIKQGRSNQTQSHWRGVVFNETTAPIVRHRVRTCANATLRDRANFVIGNVPSGWRIHVTGEHRSNGHWVKVNVPNAKRWGWVEKRVITCRPAADAAQAPRTAPPAATPTPTPPAAPAPAPTPENGGTMCHWKVVWPAAGVYDDPSRSAPLLKTKHSGDVVGPFCVTQVNASENETFVQVQTEAAPDGIGWMRMPALRQV
ncbi:hypothetical protein [Wenjunlia tyrosinilytica]|uniref:Uncharacterized protein n=1 Tax=Wenjunlia tyrosinilytica TaxID=1544741 RepID=A0A917ZMK3_9ACTN|nr:hypothetical protein [Wenjunlia tyrosinilytica]GGO86624.1 hypothetical protein GCM10012280_23190 [Wenjunlia tyrosinilytica]